MVPDQVFSWPPRRFRQVGGEVSEMIFRINLSQARREVCPYQRNPDWRSTDRGARRLQRWRMVKHGTRSQRLLVIVKYFEERRS